MKKEDTVLVDMMKEDTVLVNMMTKEAMGPAATRMKEGTEVVIALAATTTKGAMGLIMEEATTPRMAGAKSPTVNAKSALRTVEGMEAAVATMIPLARQPRKKEKEKSRDDTSQYCKGKVILRPLVQAEEQPPGRQKLNNRYSWRCQRLVD
ncbi:hypothetical protein FRC11_004654 [Ceratobasidium sp. 423]|nr:hypothetical protein FRC11_004654 [Ceratobasidium sp. 423]